MAATVRASVLVTVVCVMTATPAFAEEKLQHAMHGAIAASMLAHAADLGTTMYALGKDPDHFKEANPILRPLSDQPVAFSLAKFGVAVGLNYLLLKQHQRHPKATLIAAIASAVVTGYVAKRNHDLLKGHR